MHFQQDNMLPQQQDSFAAGRLLLQQQQQPADVTCQLQLRGVSVGGWITLSLFIGMFIGSISTLLIQCWRRRRELRYMDKGSAVRQSLVMMQALPPAPSRMPGACMQQTAALPASTPPAGSVQGAGGASKQYFSPLNTNKGMVHAQLSEMRSSMHFSGSDNGGDLSVAASDQQAPRDKNGANIGQAAAIAAAVSTGAAERGREFSQHGMRLQERRSHSGPAWSSPAPGVQGSAAAAPGSQGLLQGAIVNSAGTQLPQELSSSILSADGPLHAEDSSPAQTNTVPAAPPARGGSMPEGSSLQAPGQQQQQQQPAAAASSPAGTAPSPRQQAHLPGSPDKAGAEVRSSAGTAGKQAQSPGLAEIEDEYEDDDLDEDWRALLGGVDARLKLQGAHPMNARERAVAIKKLLVATGTRGVEFALNSTIQEVLTFRQLHGH